MTFEQAAELLAIMKAAFPNAYKGMSLKDAETVCKMWATQFSQIEGNLVMLAVKRLIKTCTFAPSIAEVRNELKNIYEEAKGALMFQNLESLYSEEMLRKLKYIVAKLECMDARRDETSLLRDLKGSDMLKLGGGDSCEKIQS